MLKKISTMFVFLLLLAGTSKAQWTYEGAWPDTNYKGGTHGIEVTPDGKIWTASYYRQNWVSPNGDTLSISPIFVFSADGSHVDTIGIVTGAATDTLGLGGGTRGMGKDQDGNILITFTGPGRIVKINYQTYEGMAKHLLTEVGSSPTAPSVSNDGTIYVGPVVGGGTTAIAMYDSELNYLGNAVLGPPNISRTMEVAPDGNAIYWTPFTGDQTVRIYTRPDEFSDFAMTDSMLTGMSLETTAWNPATGLLWVSNDSRGTGPYTHLTWYGVDVTTKAIVDSFTLPSPDPTPSDELPRGLAFSADGNTAYVGLFGTKYNRLYKFTKGSVGVEELAELPTGYSLSQNYPNPFNPTTNIKFSIPENGFVSLKVFNTLGQEVATLINEVKSSGTYQVDFNASNLASGMYVYTLTSGSVNISKKMILMK